MIISFEEDTDYGYKGRTIKNASADVTIAFAVDFNSAGEKLTKKSVLEQNKLYLPVDLMKLTSKEIFNETSKFLAIAIKNLKLPEITLNIAGNGLYTLRNTIITNQKTIDYYIFMILKEMCFNLEGDVKITLLRSGGQSGADESGIKAGFKLGIPTYVLAPKGWVYRDEKGIDYSDEIKFKQRFEI